MTKYENANKINFNFAFQNQIPVYYIKEQNKNDNSCLQTSSCHVKFNFFVKTTIYKKSHLLQVQKLDTLGIISISQI